jgi:hypothetical protein
VTWDWAGWAILAACGLSMLLLRLVLRQLSTVQSRTVMSRTVRRADERVLAFAQTYVVPVVIVAFGRNDLPTLIGTLGLVAFLGWIYVRAGPYHLNPTLALVGYRLYRVTAGNDTETMLLTREKHLPQAGRIECRFLGDDVAIQLGGPR